VKTLERHFPSAKQKPLIEKQNNVVYPVGLPDTACVKIAVGAT
jgi:hypothetical protein